MKKKCIDSSQDRFHLSFLHLASYSDIKKCLGGKANFKSFSFCLLYSVTNNHTLPRNLMLQKYFSVSSESTKRALLVALVLITGSIFMGFVAVQVFAEPLFYILAPTLDANLCSILLAVVSIIFNLIAAYCTDKAGRKVIILYCEVDCKLRNYWTNFRNYFYIPD